MAAASFSSFDGLAGQELASRLDEMRLNLHLQLCDKIRRDYLIRRDNENEEEDNRVSSENREGRLDYDSGSNDVKLKSGGSIEEPEHKTAETPGPTDGLESFVQSFIVQWLREHINLDNWETIFQNFDLDDEFWFEGKDDVRIDSEGEDYVRIYSEGEDDVRIYTEGEVVAELSAPTVRTDSISTDNEEEDNYFSFRIDSEGEDDQVIGLSAPMGRTDSISTDNEEEDNHVSSEHKTAETIISHGTDGLESCVQSVIALNLRELVDLDNGETTIENFDLENVLRTNPSYCALLEQIINNVRIDFLRMRETNRDLSLEDWKLYCTLLCWPSNKRVGFWSDLSDELLSRADELEKLRLELDGTWQLHFGEKRNDKIDDGLLSSADELKKLMLEFERTWQPYFGKKRNDKIEELLSRVDGLKKSMLEFKRTWQLHFDVKRNDKMDELLSRADELLSRADELLSRADELKELRLELERTWQLHFGEKGNGKIDEEWIKEFGEDWRPHLGEKQINKIDEKWIEKNGKKWIDKKIESEEWIDKNIEKWIETVDLKFRPRGSDFIYVRGLLRFLRNRVHHVDEFQESRGLRSMKSFYNYFDTLFPYLLMVSYGVSYRFCKEGAWFKEYR